MHAAQTLPATSHAERGTLWCLTPGRFQPAGRWLLDADRSGACMVGATHRQVVVGPADTRTEHEIEGIAVTNAGMPCLASEFRR